MKRAFLTVILIAIASFWFFKDLRSQTDSPWIQLAGELGDVKPTQDGEPPSRSLLSLPVLHA